MKNHIDLPTLMTEANGEGTPPLAIFAVLNLGIVELLANGALSTTNATQFFFNAQNCLHVRKVLRDKLADEIMSHGVQLQDLFSVLPEREAQQEFQRELTSIRSLCLQLLQQHELVA